MTDHATTDSQARHLTTDEFQRLSEKVLGHFATAGWAAGRGALAAKDFKTIQGDRAAVAYFYRDDGFHNSLAFNFNSEGRNVCSTVVALIPVGAADTQIETLVMAAIEEAEQKVAQSFAVRALAF